MSALYSAASADSTLPLAEPPPGSAKPTSIAPPSSTNIGPVSRSCPTCGNSTQLSDESTYCTAAIRASRSPSQANEEANPIPAICGLSSRDSFGFYDPASSSVKTSQATFDLDSTESLPILPAWGCMCGGELYVLLTSVPLISEPGCSSLLPTPSSQEPGFKNRTPVTKDGETPTHGSQRWYDAKTGRLMQKGLMQVAALLPTPGANDSTGSEGQTRKARQENGDTGGPSLRDLTHLLPTPMANQENPGTGGELRAAITHGPTRRNETGIDTMGRPNIGRTGEPMSLRSDGGNESADSQPPDQLTIEDD